MRATERSLRPPTCGVSTTLGSAARARGTPRLVLEHVERGGAQAPGPERATSAASSTSPPRDVLTRTLLGPHQRELARADQPRVSSVSGACSETTSARRSSSGSATTRPRRRARPGRRPAARRRSRAAAAPPRGRSTRSRRARPSPVQVPRRQVAAAPPLAAAHRRVVLDDAPQRGEDHRERVVGGGLAVGARRRGHDDARLGRGGQVDRVGADADAGDDAQPRRGAEDGAVERVGAHDRGDRAARAAGPSRRGCARRSSGRGRRPGRPPAAARRCAGRRGRSRARSPAPAGRRRRHRPSARSPGRRTRAGSPRRCPGARPSRRARPPASPLGDRGEDALVLGQPALAAQVGARERRGGRDERAVDRLGHAARARGCPWRRSAPGGTRCRPRGRGPPPPGSDARAAAASSGERVRSAERVGERGQRPASRARPPGRPPRSRGSAGTRGTRARIAAPPAPSSSGPSSSGSNTSQRVRVHGRAAAVLDGHEPALLEAAHRLARHAAAHAELRRRGRPRGGGGVPPRAGRPPHVGEQHPHEVSCSRDMQ